MKSVLSLILDNEHLTRGLGDAEARRLVEWLVERAESRHAAGCPTEELRQEMAVLCRRARAMARFVMLWCEQGLHGAAIQLAATERFPWPLPTTTADPYDLLDDILTWEDDQIAENRRHAA